MQGVTHWLAVGALSLVGLLVSCGSDDGAGIAGGGAGGTGPGTGGSGASGGSLSLGGSAGDAGDAGVTFGNEDTCDGIDNDHNGIIDDVDVGKDGICDCLRIATLGKSGNAGVSNVFDTWLSARSTKGTTNLDDQVLTPSLLAEFQVIVSQNVSGIGRSYSASEVAALKSWIDNGGGFMTLIGYADPTEIQNVNLLLAPFGMSYGPEQILQKQGSSTVPITNWIQHPVTTGVSLLGVDNGYPVNGAGSVLASEQGWNVLRVQETGKGRIEMWGDEWITFDSEWSGHPEYQVELFWLNSIKWLTPPDQCQVPIPPSIQ